MIRCNPALAAVFLVSLCAQAEEKEKPGPKRPAYAVPDQADFTIRDVTVERFVGKKDGKTVAFDIAGSLRVPKSGKKARWPAVLWISGSGSQTRHGYAPQGGNRILDPGSWQIHDAVAEAGFVVLCLDDRGIGKTPLGEEGVDKNEIGYDELVGDAQACLDWLRKRDEVDPKGVFIIGHSEGGLTAPILASRNDWVAGILCMGALGRNLWDVTLDQVGTSMKNQPAAMREANLKAQREFMGACKEDREPNFSILGPMAARQLEAAWKAKVAPIKAWWRDHFNLDVPEIHRGVACPVFIAHGEKDFQTHRDKDAKQFLKDLLDGPCTDVHLKVYADLDHLFKACGGKESTIKMYFTDRKVDEDFIADIVAWLKSHS
ncbi:MAG: alpha/beta hydrolase family protein [Planctomycetota bacterium]